MDLTLGQSDILLMALLALWTLPFKGFALWRSAERKDKWWFIAFLLTNTLAIVEIIYLFFILPRRQAKEKESQKV